MEGRGSTDPDFEGGGERPGVPRAIVDLHLSKLASWMILSDFHIDMMFLQLVAMNKDDEEHYGLNRKSMKYKMRYLRRQGLISESEYQALDGFRKDLDRLFHDKAETMRWIAADGDAKRAAVENAERAVKISKDAMLRLPQQLKWN